MLQSTPEDIKRRYQLISRNILNIWGSINLKTLKKSVLLRLHSNLFDFAIVDQNTAVNNFPTCQNCQADFSRLFQNQRKNAYPMSDS